MIYQYQKPYGKTYLDKEILGEVEAGSLLEADALAKELLGFDPTKGGVQAFLIRNFSFLPPDLGGKEVDTLAGAAIL